MSINMNDYEIIKELIGDLNRENQNYNNFILERGLQAEFQEWVNEKITLIKTQNPEI